MRSGHILGYRILVFSVTIVATLLGAECILRGLIRLDAVAYTPAR